MPEAQNLKRVGEALDATPTAEPVGDTAPVAVDAAGMAAKPKPKPQPKPAQETYMVLTMSDCLIS